MPRINQQVPINLARPFTLSDGSSWDVSQDLVSYYRPTYATDGILRDETGRGNDLYLNPGNIRPKLSNDNPEIDPVANRVAASLLFKSDTITNLVDYLDSTRELPDHVMRRSDGTADVPFSISAWFKLNDTSNASVIFEKYAAGKRELDLFVGSDNRVNFRLGNGSSEGIYKGIRSNTGAITDGTWHHTVVTYDGVITNSAGTSFDIYIDGLPVAKNISSLGSYQGVTGSGGLTRLGAHINTSGDIVATSDVSGSIYSVGIWRRQLSSAEVLAIYSGSRSGGLELNAESGFVSRSPRLHLRELDDLPGAYSTVRRTGDPTRTGTLISNFNDETSIVFSEASNVVFPAMLPKGSSFMGQAVDIIGQESDISASLPIRSFQQPTHLHYSPTEAVGPFDENRTMPATDFYLSGTDVSTLPGFKSDMRSKVSFSVDITPESDTIFTRNVEARNISESQPAGATNTGFMYYNFARREWEQIGIKDPALVSTLYYDYDISSYDPFVGIAPSGTLPAQFSVSPSLPYSPDSEKESLGYSKIGTPISAFGAPNAEMYHATSSQCLKMSDFISDPFLLEGVRVEFAEVKAQRVQGDSFVGTPDDEILGYSALFQSGAIRDIDNYTFFMYRQSRKNRMVDSIADVSSSERYLILSGAMTFWNSASFESNQVRYENQDVNFSLTHSPAFSHEFGLPYSSSLDTRLTDWDPSHDTYYVDDVLFDVTSNCVAHFNFESDAFGGETVPDKSGNGHVATIDASPIALVIGPESLDPDGNPGFPTTNYMGLSFFDAGAYITNRGYLTCLVLDAVTPAMVIDHAADLQLTLGQPFSISMWINPNDVTPTNQQCILSKADNTTGTQVEYSIILDTGGKIVWRVYGTGTPGSYIQKVTSSGIGSIYSSSGWYHLIVSYSGGTAATSLRIFINGAEVNATTSSSGTFTSPLNYSHDVLVAGLGASTEAFAGFMGSLEFYSLYVLNTSARKLYLLQETPFLNTTNVTVGQFTGSIDMNLKPAVCNRQSFGLSAYSNNDLQNVWLGGTSSRKFNESSWEVYIGYPANPFEIGPPGGPGAPPYNGKTIDDGRFSSIVDSRATRFFGLDSSDSDLPEQQSVSGLWVANDATEQGTTSPYLLMPEDELIFGMDAGICSMRFISGDENLSNLTGSHLMISSKPCKVTLFGSLIKNGSAFSAGLNQDLSSNSIHEVIGAEPILDQFMIEPRSSYYGSYLDEIVTGSMAILNTDGTTFTIYDQDNSRRVVGRKST